MRRTLKKAANCVLGHSSPCDVPKRSTSQSPRSLRPCLGKGRVLARLGWAGATKAFLNVLSGYLYPFVVAALFVSAMACSGLTLEEQKAQIRNEKIHFDGLTAQAFLETWGKPAYTHRERMQFYTLDNGNSIPRFRTPMGEPPQGWSTAIISEDAIFFGYPERGELLGFAEGRLVYREQVPAAEIHSIAKAWAHEDRFKTRLETPAPATPAR